LKSKVRILSGASRLTSASNERRAQLSENSVAPNSTSSIALYKESEVMCAPPASVWMSSACNSTSSLQMKSRELPANFRDLK
jgi:hypothetical protein